MIAKYKFEQFDFARFTGFVNDLISTYGMGDIRFSSLKNGNFIVDNKWTLEHLGDTSVKNAFVNVWSNNLDKMRVVSFELFKRNGGLPKIKMTFDLNKNTIFLDKAQGISEENVRVSLEKFFDAKLICSGASVWWKYTHPAWWIIKIIQLPIKILGWLGFDFEKVKNLFFRKTFKLVIGIITFVAVVIIPIITFLGYQEKISNYIKNLF